MEICTSHFKEDLRWLEKSPWPVSIVHHEGGDPVDYTYLIPNKGFEATSYLKYIIERYDTLPEHVAFIHGHEEAYHQQGDRPLLEMIRTANIAKYDYVPLNNTWRCMNSQLQMKAEIEFANKYQLPAIPENFILCSGAQFIVSKEAIQRNSKSVYHFLYNIIDDKTSAIFFEMKWHHIFGCGASIIPRDDYFCPPLKEILYDRSCRIPIYLEDFTACIIGTNPVPGMIHIKTQEEYDYYNIRGATFFCVEGDDITDVPFEYLKFNIVFANDVTLSLIFETIKIFNDIARTLSNH